MASSMWGQSGRGRSSANWATLGQALRQKTGGNPTARLFVRADQNVAYADVMRLMDVLHRGGYKDKTLVSEDVTG